MPATVWKGFIRFGLVSIPVRLFTGARGKTISFHLLHRTDNSRIREVMYCASENKPLQRSDLVKGYEYKKGRYIVVTPEEVKRVAPKTQTVMEILHFVKGDEIDPIFFEASYYVAPDANGQKPYALLLEALRKTEYDGLAKMTMHGREHIVILRPTERGMMLHTMYYADEVRNVAEFKTHRNLVSDKELQLATTLVSTLTSEFRPEQYKDTYRENLQKLIAAKSKGKEIKAAPAPKAAKVVDIMEALRQSLNEKKTGVKRASKQALKRKRATRPKAA
jgi:DNA end-binding protein Ku